MQDPALRAGAPLLRPTFAIELHPDPDATMSALRARLAEAPRTPRCTSKGRCAELFLSDDDRRLWSPYLSVQAEETTGGHTRLHGRFAPYPEVWTFFMFAYFGAWFAVLFGGAFGYAQWASGEAAWGLWGVWLGAPLVGILHLASLVGQRMGGSQMSELRLRLDTLLEGIAPVVPISEHE